MRLNYKINHISAASRFEGHGQFRADQFLQIPSICPVIININCCCICMGNATHSVFECLVPSW